MSLHAEDDAIVAEIALRRGWIDREALQRALEIQSAASAIELDERLLDILVTKGFITDRQARELEDEIGLGRLVQPEHCHEIDGYRILDKLGQGGMGAVFKAIQLSMKRLVALKVLAPELAVDAGFVERFQREARAIGRASHPNVVSGLDSGRCGDFHYYAMEYVEGRNLYDVLADGPLPVRQVLAIAEQMGRALQHIASLGLVHRDVKPSNIILTRDGVARLCDLGLARAPDDPSVTDTGIPIGTPHYAAPELADGSRDADIRSDLYALGGTLYHLLTGRYPFQADSTASLIEKHRSEPVRPPAELRRDVPRGLGELICRLLAKSPGERIQSPGEMVGFVRAVRATLPAADASTQGVADADLPRIAPPIAVPRREPEPEHTPAARIVEPADPTAPVDPDADEVDGEPVRRGWVTAAWAVVYLALIAVLAIAVGWAVRARRERSKGSEPTTQTSPKTETPPKPESSRPPEPGPEPDAARAAERAATLARSALAFAASNPSAHEEALLRLRRAVLARPDGETEDRVRKQLAARRAALQRDVRTDYDKLVDRVRALREQDAFGRALDACAAFPEELRAERGAELLDAQIATVGAQAERRALDLATAGALLLQKHNFDDARRSYVRIGQLGVPWLAASGRRLAAAADQYAEAEAARLRAVEGLRAAEQRRRAFAGLKNLYDEVNDALSQKQYLKAHDLCRAAKAKHTDGALAAAVAGVEARVRVLVRLWSTLLGKPERLRGKQFKLHGQDATIVGIGGTADRPILMLRLGGPSSTKTLSRRIRGLPLEEFIRLVEWAIAPEPADDRAMMLGLLYLSQARPKDARDWLYRARDAGTDVTASMAELDARAAVDGAKAALKKEDWKQAKALLLTALDRYATTTAAVSENAWLNAALKQCRVKLGEPVADGTIQPGPLPLALRRVDLLPATRLSASPPAKALAAFRGEPLERGSPTVVGLDTWTDYTIDLAWTPERGSAFVLLFRLTEPRAGRFSYYYLSFDGERLALGRSLSRGVTALQSAACPALRGRSRHRAVVAVLGGEIVVDVDGTYRLRATDTSLPRGNLAVAVRGSEILIHELSIVFPAAKPASR